jgi:hypothetical protein
MTQSGSATHNIVFPDIPTSKDSSSFLFAHRETDSDDLGYVRKNVHAVFLNVYLV